MPELEKATCYRCGRLITIRADGVLARHLPTAPEPGESRGWRNSEEWCQDRTVVGEAVEALRAFGGRDLTRMQVRLLLAMWKRRSQLTDAECAEVYLLY